MEMKTLTVNGQTYTVADPDAAHIDDAVISHKAWSGKNIVDRLCPAFAVSGPAVTCQPVGDYPLQVVSCIEPVQSGSGGASPGNVRPITGHTGVTLRHTGKNLLPYPYKETTITKAGITFTDNGDGTITANGTAIYDVTFALTDTYDPSADFERCVASGCPLGGSADTYYISSVDSGHKDIGNGFVFTYIKKSFSRWAIVIKKGVTVENLVFKPQIEIGRSITQYQPYRGREITAGFGQTVYGGSYDWQTGMLTVTHGYIDSYAGEAVPEGWISSMGQLWEGAQVVYPLETPVTVQLTPREIYALPGINTFVGNTGDITVKGRADLAALVTQLHSAIAANKVQESEDEENV